MTTTRPVEKSVYNKAITSIRQSLATFGVVSLKSLNSTAEAILRAGDVCFSSLAFFTNPSLNSHKSDALAPLLIPIEEPTREGRMPFKQAHDPETGVQGLRK